MASHLSLASVPGGAMEPSIAKEGAMKPKAPPDRTAEEGEGLSRHDSVGWP